MGEVIYIDQYLERRTAPSREDLTKRLAEIATQQLLLASEKHRLEAQLLTTPDE